MSERMLELREIRKTFNAGTANEVRSLRGGKSGD